ncbi:V-type proton ATPase subunit H [Cyphellophora attinorum]|uniref:V-type proton ATPase subunit H n=1 Tax=Cyphellophora attinorum TaxID=1664694 RepID=A0A0N1H309_9EURO|nr:V-type proton ATPase subunit H [Phialophora attinorum]KPI39084.1 V-type proton ATPase subunit H [Phialophora attinorum]
MSLAAPAYLNSLQSNIRARPIPWDGAVRAGNLTEEQLKKIKSVDKVRKEQRKQTIEKDVKNYSNLLVGSGDSGSVFNKASKRTDILQYILVLANDLISDAPELAGSILEHSNPYQHFISFLSQSNNPEDPIPLLSATFLVNLVAYSITANSKPQKRDDEALSKLFSYLSTLAKNQDSGLQDIAVQHYSSLLRTSQSKKIFWKQKQDTVGPLFDILRKAAGAARDSDSTLRGSGGASSIRSTDTRFAGGVGLQLVYNILLVIWQLSFEAGFVGEDMEKDEEVIPLYTQLLRVSAKEKTTRLLLSTLHNLLDANKEALIPAATTARLPALLTNLNGRHLSDPDLLEDLEALTNLLDDYTKNQTTFDEYADEVNSGHLRWSPPHKNPQFWRENSRKILEDNKGALPKKLAEILGKSWDNDKKVLAIGCNDLGNLVREAPEHRTTLEKLGLKGRVMELMNDSDESVRWESLKAVGGWMRYSMEN